MTSDSPPSSGFVNIACEPASLIDQDGDHIDGQAGPGNSGKILKTTNDLLRNQLIRICRRHMVNGQRWFTDMTNGLNPLGGLRVGLAHSESINVGAVLGESPRQSAEAAATRLMVGKHRSRGRKGDVCPNHAARLGRYNSARTPTLVR